MTDDSDTLDRDAILARRGRFITAALAGLATSTLATACPCLDVGPPPPDTDGTDDGTDGDTEPTEGSDSSGASDTTGGSGDSGTTAGTG